MKEIKLLTGLRRGNIASVAGEVVEVEDGLARRLVDRGQAVLVDRVQDVPKTRTKKEAAKSAAAAPAAPIPPAPDPADLTPASEDTAAPAPEVPADPAADTSAVAGGDAAE